MAAQLAAHVIIATQVTGTAYHVAPLCGISGGCQGVAQ